MSTTPFEDLKVTTMTLIIPFDGDVDIDTAFWFLPITHFTFNFPRRQTKKFKIPYSGIPGAILSMRYKNFVRGIIRSTSTKFFKHSITMDISTHKRNISLKLSRSKIQLCGATSIEDGLEAVNYVMTYLAEVKDTFEYMREHT